MSDTMSRGGLSDRERMDHKPEWSERGNHLDIWAETGTFSGKNKGKECACCLKGVSGSALCWKQVRSGQVRDENEEGNVVSITQSLGDHGGTLTVILSEKGVVEGILASKGHDVTHVF